MLKYNEYDGQGETHKEETYKVWLKLILTALPLILSILLFDIYIQNGDLGNRVLAKIINMFFSGYGTLSDAVMQNISRDLSVYIKNCLYVGGMALLTAFIFNSVYSWNSRKLTAVLSSFLFSLLYLLVIMLMRMVLDIEESFVIMLLTMLAGILSGFVCTGFISLLTKLRLSNQECSLQRKLFIIFIIIIIVLFYVGMINYFSSLDGEASNMQSQTFIEKISPSLKQYFAVDSSERADVESVVVSGVRKLAHRMEYLMLGVIFSWSTYIIGSRIWVGIPLSFAMTFAVAALDEFHQTFIPGRTGLFSDVLIDMHGATAGICVSLAVWLICNIQLYIQGADKNGREKMKK